MSKPPRSLPPETGRRTIGSNWKPVCRYCKQNITNPRRSSFCDDSCVVEFMVRSDPKFARKYILDRDGGLCQACGLDVQMMKEVYDTSLYLAESEFEADLIRDRLLALGFHPKRAIYEIDHIVELQECVVSADCSTATYNGVDIDVWAPSNLQALCLPCHLKKSKETNARMALKAEEKDCKDPK